MSTEINIVLAGNPNCGKSTIFNQITGARQHIGNYPGVTVEKMEGACSFQGHKFNVVDLPGAYSLDAHSEDEAAAANYLRESIGKDRILIDVIDSVNFERNLFLTLQLRELGIPMIILLNMTDLAHQRGFEFRKDEISRWFGAPVLECVGYTGQGLNEVLQAAIDLSHEIEAGNKQKCPNWVYELSQNGTLPSSLSEEMLKEANAEIPEEPKAATDVQNLDETQKASLYYDAISRIVPELMTFTKGGGPAKESLLDRVFLHRIWGLPLFFLMLYLIFQLTFTVGAYPMGWIESGVEALKDWIGGLWTDGSESLVRSLIIDGIIGGVGNVVVFLPNILLLFLAISLLEDSGYMARAAVLMDRFMSKIGLHGKSFIPMLVGFGCSIPGIMATRTLEERRERLATMFVVPLMSCGARLPIYALLIPAFFPVAWQGTVLFGVYMVGILLAIIVAKVLSMTVLRGEPIPFVMELPPYHTPTMQTVGLRTLQRGWLYLRKAGTIILGISVILWALTTFPRLPEDRAAQYGDDEGAVQEATLEYSGAGRLGKAIEPVMKPMGMDWKLGTAFIGAFAAKEVFVAQMGIVYSAGDIEEDTSSLRDIMAKNYTPLQGVCILLFALIATPCMATFAVMAREAGSWKWAFAQWFTLTAMAWVICTIVYQVGIHFVS
ncbi:MAG: ferrous iron transport protein B [Thermoguttaceae bacterium]|nr:ferrous iron transport protein B [Thermoguttaceae bacterium]